MNVSRTQKIIATVIYADVFHYPLTRDEVLYWGQDGADKTVGTIRGIERTKRAGKEYFFLRGRGRIVNLRIQRSKIASRKWHHIYHLMKYFRFIPTLLLVGVTGGLAVNNAKKEDDIDVFCITRKNTLWFTRGVVTLVADWLGVRRRPNDGSVADKICINMFMAEDALGLPSSEQDLFAAHEVLQMVPLWERDGVYRAFLSANRWVKQFAPHAWKERLRVAKAIHRKKQKRTAAAILSLWVPLVEPISRFVQLRYMKRRRTNEVIRSGMIRFHPRDARQWVREKFEKRLKLHHIPLDKIFYRR